MTDTGFWKAYHRGRCWVCGKKTHWVWADLGYQHRDCDAGPSSNGGHYRVVRGVLTENTGAHTEEECPGPENCDGFAHAVPAPAPAPDHEVLWRLCPHGQTAPHWFYLVDLLDPNFAVQCEGGREVVVQKVTAEWEGDTAVIRVDPGGEYLLYIDKETRDES